MKDQLTNRCPATMRLVEMKDQLTNAWCTTMRLVEMNNKLTNACHTTMRLDEIDLQDDISYIVKTTVDATDGSLQQETHGSTVMNSCMRQSDILVNTNVINWANDVVMKFFSHHQDTYNEIFGHG